MCKEYNGFSLTCREKENVSRIDKLEKEELKTAGNYKELGDCYINSYLNKYADAPTINKELAEKSFEAYEKACKIYKDTDCHKKYMGTMMALGNAYKEAVLPCHYDNTDFTDFIEEKYNKAKESYQRAIDHYYETGKAFRKEYYFIMFEQMNLEIRKKAWEKKRHPKRINVYHSLSSPMSHLVLHNIYYQSFLKGFELWEYRFGSVPTQFDEISKYIFDRLNETQAIVFLLSKEYDYNNPDRPVVKQEVDAVCKAISNNIPLKVVIIKLGNDELITKFKKLKRECKKNNWSGEIQLLKETGLKKLYAANGILKNAKNIYERRKWDPISSADKDGK